MEPASIIVIGTVVGVMSTTAMVCGAHLLGQLRERCDGLSAKIDAAAKRITELEQAEKREADLTAALSVAQARITELEAAAGRGIGYAAAAGLETAALEALVLNMRAKRVTEAVTDALRTQEQESECLRGLLAQLRENPNGFKQDVTRAEYMAGAEVVKK